jgi:hypothetical protein
MIGDENLKVDFRHSVFILHSRRSKSGVSLELNSYNKPVVFKKCREGDIFAGNAKNFASRNAYPQRCVNSIGIAHESCETKKSPIKARIGEILR